MSENGNRPLWQFHLSTALIMVLLAAVLIVPVIAELMKPETWQTFDDKGRFNVAATVQIIIPIIEMPFVLGIGLLLEWRIRQREARKKQES